MSKLSFLLFPLALLFFHCKNDVTAPKAAEADVPPMTIDTVTGAPIRSDNPWINRTCDLIVDGELKVLFGEKGMETLNRATLPEKSMCLITWMKPDWMQRESNNDEKGATYQEPKNTLVLTVVNYGTAVMAEQQFALLDPETNETYDQHVVGLGDAAVWSMANRTLSIRKGHLMLNVNLDYTDDAIDNLPKAQEVAKTALAKM